MGGSKLTKEKNRLEKSYIHTEKITKFQIFVCVFSCSLSFLVKVPNAVFVECTIPYKLSESSPSSP
jgi:hypothetical protein